MLLFLIKKLIAVDTNKRVWVIRAKYTIESTWMDIFNREKNPDLYYPDRVYKASVLTR